MVGGSEGVMVCLVCYAFFTIKNVHLLNWSSIAAKIVLFQNDVLSCDGHHERLHCCDGFFVPHFGHAERNMWDLSCSRAVCIL